MIPVQFEDGVAVSDYLDTLKNYRSLVRRLLGEATPAAEHVKALTEGAAKFPQPVRATVMTEDWCGDSACNLPILEKLFAEADVPFVAFHGSENKEIKKYYHALDVDHIPVVSLWDGNGEEIGRWVEEPAAITPMKAKWKEARPEFMELYAKRDTDREAGKKFASLYRKFLEEMAVWYTEGLWKETTREIVEITAEHT